MLGHHLFNADALYPLQNHKDTNTILDVTCGSEARLTQCFYSHAVRLSVIFIL